MPSKRRSLSSIYLRNKNATTDPGQVNNGDVTQKIVPLGTEENHENQPVFDQFDELAKPRIYESDEDDATISVLSHNESNSKTADGVPHFVTTFHCGHADDEIGKAVYDNNLPSSYISAQNLHPKPSECERPTKCNARSDEAINDLNEVSLTSFDNFKYDSGIQSNLDVSDLPLDSSMRKMEMCKKFCTEVNLQLIQYRNKNPDINDHNCPNDFDNYPMNPLEPQTLPELESGNEITFSDYESTRNSEFEYLSTEFADSDNECNYGRNPLKKKLHSQYGEITIEKEAVAELNDECSKVIKLEIITKNQEIKELKMKLKIEKEKNKELSHQIDKGEKEIFTIQKNSTAEIRHLRQELKNLRKERESLKQELSEKAIEERQQKASVRRKSLQEVAVKKLHELGTKRDKVLESKSILALKEDIKRKEKELNQSQKTIHKLECEKLYLGEEIYRITGVEEGFWVDEQLPRPSISQKEKCLVRKNSTLNTKVSSLQKHCNSLSKENVSLKNKMEVQVERPLARTEHEKIRLFELQKLKRKNMELSSATKKLEEKVKTLEKKVKVAPNNEKRFPLASQKKEKEKAMSYQRQIQQRDLEIQRMKIRMRDLVKKLTGKNGEITRAQSTQELEHIMKVVTKERLQLERHLAMANQGLLRVSNYKEEQESELNFVKNANSTLHQQLNDLEILTRQHNTLEKHVQEKDLECVTLKEKLKLKNEICLNLEHRLAKVIEKNTELTIQNSDLHKQIQELQHVTVSEECRSLKQTLGRGLEGWTSRSDPSAQQCSTTLDFSYRWDNAYSMSDGNRSRNEASVEHVLTQMKEAAEKKKELEKQHSEALYQLHEKQAALEGALGSKPRRKECSDAIEALKSKIRELEKKAEVQNLRHEELLLEMQSMKKGQSSPKNSWSRSGSLSAELQSPESGDITPGLSSIASTVSSSYLPPHFSLLGDTKPLAQRGPTTNSEIDKIVAKIRQDNKILAALDKTRTSAGIPTLTTTASSMSISDASFISNLGRSHGLNTSSVLQNIYSTPLNSSTVTTMAALDLSQPFTSTLVNSLSNPIGGLLDPNLSHLNLGTSLGPNSFSTYLSSLPGSSLLSNTISGTSPNGLGAMGLGVHGLNLLGTSPSGLMGDSGLGHSSLPTIITTSYDKDDKNIINGNIPGVMLAPNSLQTDNRILDVLEIPGKGRCHVYIARYSYDPFRQSPNENPEAELTLNAGDYVLVWGSMDEVSPRTIDGFFDGEVLDGRRGLVPSNFVEKLVGDDLIEFHQSIVMGLRECDESVSTSVPQDLDFISQDETQMLMELGLNPHDSSSYSSYLDLEDFVEDNEDPHGEQDLFFSVLVPPPVQLTLERQLNKSILIGWNPPSEAPPGTIESYHVYVNGLLKTTVKANERTRALVEGVDCTRLHRISVRSVTPNRRTSRDAACTMIIGNDPPLGPTHVRASNITSTSAVISWLPSNSNFQHSVCVNSVEVRTVKPGVYRHTITGLSPNTVYRVTIRAKNLRAPQFHEKLHKAQERLSSSVEFRTLPKGLPEPPVDVQVEMGPQDGSLLVTWLPVTIDSNGGTSNGAPVTGYAVYADGKKITEVDSPTGDHALIDLTQIHGFEPKQITVRTKSRESVSADSVPTLIPIHFYKGISRHKSIDNDCSPSDYERPSDLSDIAEESETELSSDEDTLAESVKMDLGPRLEQPGASLQPTARGIKDKLFGRRTPAAPTAVHTDHLGQTILEHEENLSDKEVYPGQHVTHLPTPHGAVPHHIGAHATGPHAMGSHAVPHAPGLHGQGLHGPHPQAPHQTLPTVEVPKDHPPGHDHHMDEYHEDDYDGRRGGRFDRPGLPHIRGGHMDRGRQQPPFHRGPQRDSRDPRDLRDPHAPWDSREQPYLRDRRDIRDRDSRDPRDMREPRIMGDTRDLRDGRNPRDFSDGRDPRDYREIERYEGPEGRHRDQSRGRGEHPRIFVALFDYDPPTMSPNPEACDEELGFREGQLIKVYGDKDPDGFYWGEAGGRGGYVPGNMVSEVQVDDDRVAQELLKESETGRRRRDQSFSRRGHAGDRWGDIYANMPVRKMVALYDYDPQELSPNVDSEVELSFQTGDIIYVYGDMDDDGFFMGELRGQRGLVPSNFLQDAPNDYDDQRSRRDTLDPRDRGYGGRGHGPGPGAHGPGPGAHGPGPGAHGPGPGAHGPGPGAHGPPPPPRPDQRDRRKGYEGPPNGQSGRGQIRPRGQLRPGEKW